MHEPMDTNRHTGLKVAFVTVLILVIAAAVCFAFLRGTHEHSSEIWVEETPATCTVQGIRYKICDECGESYGREILPVSGHDYEWTLVNTEGDSSLQMVGACSSCPETKQLPVSWDEVKITTVEPTCGNDGRITYTAIGYNGEEQVTASHYVSIDALEHKPMDPVVENVIEVGCVVDASYDSVIYCSVCNGEIERQTIVTEGAHGHVDADAVVENHVSSTCTNDGYYEHVVYCRICGEERSRIQKSYPPSAHNVVWELTRVADETFVMNGSCECGFTTGEVAIDYDLEVVISYAYECDRASQSTSASTVYTATTTYVDPATGKQYKAQASYSTPLDFHGYHVIGNEALDQYRNYKDDGGYYYNLSIFNGNLTVTDWDDEGFAEVYIICPGCGPLRIIVYNDLSTSA